MPKGRPRRALAVLALHPRAHVSGPRDRAVVTLTLTRRAAFSALRLNAVRSCPAYRSPSPGIRSAARPYVATAMQISRSVITPLTRPSPVTIGRIPQSRPHMFFAASARLVSGWHELTSVVMISRTFMSDALCLAGSLDSARARTSSDSRSLPGEEARRRAKAGLLVVRHAAHASQVAGRSLGRTQRHSEVTVEGGTAEGDSTG